MSLNNIRTSTRPSAWKNVNTFRDDTAMTPQTGARTMRRRTNVGLAIVALVSFKISQVTAACSSLDIIQQESNDTLRSWYIKMDLGLEIPVSDTLRCDDDVGGQNFFPEHGIPGNCDRDQCFLPGAHALYVRLNRTLNATLSDDTQDFIFSEVSSTVDKELQESNHNSDSFSEPIGGARLGYEEDFHWVDFNQTSIWPTQAGGGVAYHCLDRGEAGYWFMDPIWVCVEARLKDCDNHDEDVAVEACGLPARWSGPDYSRANLLSWWNITKVDPSSMTEQLVRVENATIENGEEPRSDPIWGGDATSITKPGLVASFGLLVVISSLLC